MPIAGLMLEPEPVAAKELEYVRIIREKLGHILSKDDYDDEKHLARLYRTYGDNIDQMKQRIMELKTHSDVYAYGVDNVLGRAAELVFVQKVFERFSISDVGRCYFSGDTLVFLQRMEGVDLKEILRVIPVSWILHTYVILQTIFKKMIREHELKTGRPSAVVSVIDLRGIALRDFINPFSASSQFARLVAKIWSDYFSENLVRLYLLHPPGLLSLMWGISKHILDAKTQSRIVFVTRVEDLNQHLSRDTIPAAYGGNRTDTSGFSFSPESCVSFPKPVSRDEYFNQEKAWLEYGVDRPFPEYKSIVLRPKTIHEEKIKCQVGDILVWMFTSSADVVFEIVFIATKLTLGVDKQTHFWPKTTIMTVHIPEHGALKCEHEGTYIFRFGNLAQSSSWLPSTAVKVHFALNAKKYK